MLKNNVCGIIFFTNLLASLVSGLLIPQGARTNRTFTVDRGDCNCFRKDGQIYRYASGSMHYFRVPQPYWDDRMKKFSAAGLNALETYVAWNMHEPFKRHFNFEGQLNLFEYLTTAQNNSLDVVLRIGPYIDSEWDFGGLPFWLLNYNASMAFRSRDPQYMTHVIDYWSYLLPKLVPHLYINGGNIILVQIENEYGSWGLCDTVYKNALRDLAIKYLSEDVVLFTTDGDDAGLVKCGYIEGAQATIDFGAGDNASSAFQRSLRPIEPTGPPVNSEYYPGWLDWWGTPFQHRDPYQIATSFDDILSVPNSCGNIYVFHGATSWGFLAGANGDANTYLPGITSYDYDGPISEDGDTTYKYMLIRDVIKKRFNRAVPDVPANFTKTAYNDVQMIPTATLFANLTSTFAEIGQIQATGAPMTFEAILQDYGFILYRHVISQRYDHGTLQALGIRDRGIVFVDENRVGLLSRQDKNFSLELGPLAVGQHLDILLENQGRMCYGHQLNDTKGLNVLSPLTIDNVELTNWTMFPIPLNTTSWTNCDVSELSPIADVVQYDIPARYEGLFEVDSSQTSAATGMPHDTFLQLNSTFSKGVAFINGHNLGRYWPARGPQITLYVPGAYLNVAPTMNKLVLFELDNAKCEDSSECIASFLAQPILDAPVKTDAAHQQFAESFRKHKQRHQ